MTRNSKIAIALCSLNILLLTFAADAQVVFSGVGSSAMLDTFAVAAFTQMCSARVGSDCHHWSQSGTNSGDGQNWAQAVDSRNNNIPPEGGTIFIAWDNNANPIQIWSYLSVDSAVGQRLFFANPRATLQLDSGVLGVAGANVVPPAVLLNRQTGFTQSDQLTGIPSAVLVAVQIAQFSAAVTDIRPEDAKYATNRVLSTYNVNGNGLGYNNPSISCFRPPDNWRSAAIWAARFTVPTVAGRFRYSSACLEATTPTASIKCPLLPRFRWARLRSSFCITTPTLPA